MWSIYRKIYQHQISFGNRIKNDKKKPGVLIEVRKSSMIWDIVRLIHDEVVTVKDLEGFSNELVEAVELILNR